MRHETLIVFLPSTLISGHHPVARWYFLSSVFWPSLTSTQPVFQDANGLAIKFFIQKDLSQEIQAELCETITVCHPLPLSQSLKADNRPSRLADVSRRRCHGKATSSCSLRRRRRNACASAGQAQIGLTGTLSHTPTSMRVRSQACYSSRSSPRMGRRSRCTSTRASPTRTRAAY